MAFTGGMGTAGRAATSTLLMGSRAYVSTLNENLDRGLSDGEAILSAIASAATDAVMESYSAGHLLNLEEKLGKGAIKAVDAAGRTTKNEALNQILQKGVYVLASAGSQGLTEAEEEMTTEIVNELIDRGFIKDKSQYQETIKWYQELGYTENEAKGKANVEFINRVKLASLGGLLSGATFGTLGGALNVKGGALDSGRIQVNNNVEKIQREDVETVQPKIENDVSVKEESNVNNNVDSKVKTGIESDLKRYNEIMDIMKTKGYQNYKYNYENGYAQVLRADFNKIEAELKILEKRLANHIPQQTSQTEASNAKNTKENIHSNNDERIKNIGMNKSDLNTMLTKMNTIVNLMQSNDYDAYKANPKGHINRLYWNHLEMEYDSLRSKVQQYSQIKVGNEMDNHKNNFKNQYTNSNDFDGISLKNSILKDMPKNLNDLEKARYLYLKLNEAVNYDEDYLISKSTVTYHQRINFSNMQSNQVICRSWSSLCYDILMDARFDASRVKIAGGTDTGVYKWVEIDFGSDGVLIADGTNLFSGMTDLTRAKSGMQTQGFFLHKGELIKNWYSLNNADFVKEKNRNMIEQLRSVDTNLGYTQEGMYFQEVLEQLKNDFKDPNLVNEVFGNQTQGNTEQILNYFVELSEPSMGGSEAYGYYKQLKKIFHMDSSQSPIHVTLLSHLETDGKYTLTPCISAKKEDGQYVYYLYSEKSGLFQRNADSLQQLENLGYRFFVGDSVYNGYFRR